jgi:hypothetical protein
MNALEFVTAVIAIAQNGAKHDILGALAQPPGRSPDPGLVVLSEWFTHLPESEQSHVRSALGLAVRQATYNFLLILDGLVAIEPAGEKGRLELFFEKAGERILLNAPDVQELSYLFKEIGDLNLSD